MVALQLERPRKAEQARHARQEDRCRLAAATGAHEASDRLGEEQRSRGGCRVDPDPEPRDVHTLRHHPHGHHPAAVILGEAGDPVARRLLVGKHDGRDLPGDLLEDCGIGTGRVVVGGDHEATRIRNPVAHLGEPAIGGLEHGGHPLALRIERRAPGLRRDVLRVALTEPGFHLVPGAGAPAHFARIGHEDHRTHHAVGQGPAVAVGVVGLRGADAVLIRVVRDKGDRRGIRAERRPGERQSASCRREGLADRVAPAEGITTVVHLVEYHERASPLGETPVQSRPHRDLRVGDGDAVEVLAVPTVAVLEARVEPHADAVCGIGPLPLEVLGRSHDRHAVDLLLGEELGDEPKCEGGLACARRRSDEEVPRFRNEVGLESFGLPGPQLVGRAPCSAFRKGWREMFGRRGAHRGAERQGDAHRLRHYLQRATLDCTRMTDAVA